MDCKTSKNAFKMYETSSSCEPAFLSSSLKKKNMYVAVKKSFDGAIYRIVSTSRLVTDLTGFCFPCLEFIHRNFKQGKLSEVAAEPDKEQLEIHHLTPQ